MSGENNYYPRPYNNYPAIPNPPWNNWNNEVQYIPNYGRNPDQTYPRNTNSYPIPSLNQGVHGNGHNNIRPQHGYRNPLPPPSRPPYRNRYSNHYNNNHHNNHNNNYNNNKNNNNNGQFGWQRNSNNYKRNRQESHENEPQLKTAKKKKKPLSQNVPNKKEWTPADAENAHSVEKEYNKKSKYALIIKFPDHELNKDIVSQFNSSIENVHFQQPCTPRFCFVTLQENADPEAVISNLNQQRFGEGYLSAEYKKDREDENNITSDDVDPLTLYVGNLAQEITKEDMVTMYPNSKRIDIGFAKKMKFTRYAFVGFRSVNEAIEAFKKTHNQQMYNKSLIVRFRRLHGTVGMPGEPKAQNPPKSKDNLNKTVANGGTKPTTSADKQVIGSTLPTENNSVSTAAQETVATSSEVQAFDELQSPSINPLSQFYFPESPGGQLMDWVKQELPSPVDSDDEMDTKPIVFEYPPDEPMRYPNAYKIKQENYLNLKSELGGTVNIKTEFTKTEREIKKEPSDGNRDTVCENAYLDGGDYSFFTDDENNQTSNSTDLDKLYESMVNHKSKLYSLKTGSQT